MQPRPIFVAKKTQENQSPADTHFVSVLDIMWFIKAASSPMIQSPFVLLEY